MKYMFEKFYPDSYVESAYVIDYEGLYKRDTGGLFLILTIPSCLTALLQMRGVLPFSGG